MAENAKGKVMHNNPHREHGIGKPRSRVVSLEERRERISRWVFWAMFVTGTMCAIAWKLLFADAAP